MQCTAPLYAEACKDTTGAKKKQIMANIKTMIPEGSWSQDQVCRDNYRGEQLGTVAKFVPPLQEIILGQNFAVTNLLKCSVLQFFVPPKRVQCWV